MKTSSSDDLGSNPTAQASSHSTDGSLSESDLSTSSDASDTDSSDSDLAPPYLLSLPTEILSIILIYLSTIAPLCLAHAEYLYTDYNYNLHGDNSRAKRLGWLGTAHVCSRLRNIALGMPSLWATAILAEGSTHWLPDVLHRSDAEPLSLSCHKISRRGGWRTNDRAKACDILIQPCHLPRMKSVTITDLHGWRRFARKLLTEGAPRLKILSLGPRKCDWIYESQTPTVTVLPSVLFQTDSDFTDAPPLHSLSLSCCDFLWTSLSKFSTLTVLSIIRPSTWPENTYEVAYLLPSPASATALPTTRLGRDFGSASSITEVVACLCALPCLESLTLENALPEWNSDESDLEFPRIPLVNLHSVAIKQLSLQPSSLILDLLDAPRLRKCELCYWTIARPMGPYLRHRCAMLTRFLSGFAAQLPESIDMLALDYNWNAKAYVYFGHEDIKISAYCPAMPHDPCLTITISMTVVPTSRESFPIRHACVEPIVSALPLSRLQRLDIQDSMFARYSKSFCSVDFTFWQHIYDMCMSATTIRAKGFAVIPLISLLASCNVPTLEFTSPPPIPRVPVFPNLKELQLTIGGFYAPVDLGAQQCLVDNRERATSDDKISLYMETIRDCLASRAGYAPKLESYDS